jgi:hypothetical protein
VRAADNPFSNERVTSLQCRLAGLTWDDIEARLEVLGCRAAIVGGTGSGKTTLLHALLRRLAGRGAATVSLRLASNHRSLGPVGWRALAAADAGTVVGLDGAEQLTWPVWWLVRARARRAAGLVITAHLPGRLPTLHTCRTDAALLADLVEELLPPAWPRPGRGALERAVEATSGDLRAALAALYDAVARAPSPAKIQWP